MKIIVVALAISMGYQGIIAVQQRYLEGWHRVAGTLGHANSLSFYNCIVGPVLVVAALSNLSKSIRYLCLLGVASAGVCTILTV